MSHSYPSDIGREQFARILPALESARRRTKPRSVDLYDQLLGSDRESTQAHARHGNGSQRRQGPDGSSQCDSGK